MGLFRKGKPHIQTLVRREDVQGLVEAAVFQDLMPGREGGTVDRGAPIREEAILALGAMAPDAGNGTVAAALRDPSDRVRIAAVRVLHARAEARPLAEAITWLPPGRGHSRRMALRALAELGQPDGTRLLAASLVRAPGDGPVAEEEAGLLRMLVEGEQGDACRDGVLEELLSALSDERDVVGDRAEELLVELAPASVEGVIAELGAGPAPHRAASVLARLKDTRALDPLVSALEHRDPRVRATSASALGELRDPAAVDALMRATRDPDYQVRSHAGWALDRIGMVAIVVGVAALVRPMIHETVTAALGDGAAKPSPALPEGGEAQEAGQDTAGQTGSAANQAGEAAVLNRVGQVLEDIEDSAAGQDTPAT